MLFLLYTWHTPHEGVADCLASSATMPAICIFPSAWILFAVFSCCLLLLLLHKLFAVCLWLFILADLQAVLIEHDEVSITDLSAVVTSNGHKGDNLIKDYDEVITHLSTVSCMLAALAICGMHSIIWLLVHYLEHI